MSKPTLDHERAPQSADRVATPATAAALSATLPAASLTLHAAPLATLYHFSFVLADWTRALASYLLSHRLVLAAMVAAAGAYAAAYVLNCTDQLAIVDEWVGTTLLWLLLGILSSIGLGTGLHTFVLYLGPHIAKITMAAQECHSLRFATTGPLAFICPNTVDAALGSASPVTWLQILHKTQYIGFIWGFGTALGELPPYFVARAARDASAGQDKRTGQGVDEQTDDSALMRRVKSGLYRVLQRYGFWAIALFASVPNPLFDLAGVTCGHFGVPFWTFFGATAFGKSIVKVHVQTLFVVFMFHGGHLESFVQWIERYIPTSVFAMVDQFLRDSKASFHGIRAGKVGAKPWIGVVWDLVLVLMLAGFIKSIIESAVNDRLRRVENDHKKNT